MGERIRRILHRLRHPVSSGPICMTGWRGWFQRRRLAGAMRQDLKEERWRNEPMVCPICSHEWRAAYQVFPPSQATNPNTIPCPNCGYAPEGDL